MVDVSRVLTPARVDYAYGQGLKRTDAARAQGQTDRFGVAWAGGDPVQVKRHLDGTAAVSECAVADYTGRRWTSEFATTPDDRRAGDVEGGLFVRWTRWPTGGLVVYATEPPDRPGVLVVGTYPTMWIAGWAWIGQAQQAHYWRADFLEPAYLVPQDARDDFTVGIEAWVLER